MDHISKRGKPDEKGTSTGTLLAIILPITAILLAVIGFFAYRHWRRVPAKSGFDGITSA